MRTPTRRTDTCSFCGKTQEQVRRLIGGPGGVYICDECVQLCNEILNEGPADWRLRREPPQPPSGPTSA